jgi:hypothetical protein
VDTARVDICYRPLRVAWVIDSSDKEGFRQAVRLSCALYGGRFNPIVMADRPDEARAIIELYRADMVVPVGNSKAVQEFPPLFPHLMYPFYTGNLFTRDGKGNGRSHLLDLHNALFHWRGTPAWKALDETGIRHFSYDADDPLADALLAQYGDFPDPEETGVDYSSILSEATLAIDCHLDKTAPIRPDVLIHPSIGYLARHGLRRHYTVREGRDFPGYYVGSAADLEDLVCFWNLRAADIQLQFFDRDHAPRYAAIRQEYEQRTLARVAPLAEHHRSLAVWSRSDKIEDDLKLFEGQPLTACRCAGPFFWNGGSVRPPMMIMGQASALGVLGTENGKPKVSFVLGDKPFADDVWFATQHLVASLYVIGMEANHTFRPPYVPEWNDFLARVMHFQYNKLRVEPERVGVVIDAADHDSFLYGLPTSAVVENMFASVGLKPSLSGGGLITRQLIARLGGLTGTRVFKIPGVRRLIKTYGPRDTFTKKAALQLVGGRDPNNPQATFSDHKQLHFEPRPHGIDLTPPMVFAYRVEKGLFRIGAELTCPTCNLASWIALDALKQENVCELCGSHFDATRQLVDGVFHYRRTGVLGLEKNSQGAIPVALVLQQLEVDLEGLRTNLIYAPSYDLTPDAGVNLPSCEVDFVIVVPGVYPGKTEVALGECKDAGGAIDATDVANLRSIADALPKDRFEPYIVFAKLAPFTPEEIALAGSLNGPYQARVVLLTARELEPYHVYERTEKDLKMKLPSGSLVELAQATRRLYFTAAEETATPG